jgi:hypothetical protein
MIRNIWLYLLVFSSPAFSQNQNNSPGSDCFADVPHTLYITTEQTIPVTLYFHESNCTGCTNYLTFVDIRIKNAGNSSFLPALTYPAADSAAFLAMFSEYSENNIATGTQSFPQSRPVPHSTHTIVFTADTNWWIPPVPNAAINQRYYYFTFNIPYSSWSAFDTCKAIDIKVTVGIDYDTDPEFYFRLFLSDQNFPSLPHCYYGDVHYHSYYTDNMAENGMPLEATRRAARMSGLDWITITDHSCDYDNYGSSMQDNWNRQGNEILSLNSADTSLILIRALEASVFNSNGNGQIVHALVYPDPADPFSMPYIADGGGDAFPTSVSIPMLLDSVTKYNGFCYAAHPFSEGDKLSDLIGGGVWNVNDNLYPANGQPCPQTGTVIWNDLSTASDVYDNSPGKVFKDGLCGGQIFNLFNYLTCDETDTDPWNTLYNGQSGFVSADPTDPLSYRIDQNYNTYQLLLYRGLLEKTADSSVTNWKFYFSSGSDAHGSFNYSTTEYVWGGLQGRTTESALGKAFTIAYCPGGMGSNGSHVLNAMKKGHTAISNGPALFMKVITPGGEYLPGDDADISAYSPDDVVFEIKASSNSDFGVAANVSFFRVTADDGNLTDISFPLSNGECSVTLSQILNYVNSEINPVNQYICIRSRIDTYKAYPPHEAMLRKTNELFFFCETNPVWFKTGLLSAAGNLSKSEFRVYPNPACDMIQIETKEEYRDAVIELHSLTGKSYLLQTSVSGNRWQIKTEGIPGGFYIIRIRNGESSAQAPLVIIR